MKLFCVKTYGPLLIRGTDIAVRVRLISPLTTAVFIMGFSKYEIPSYASEPPALFSSEMGEKWQRESGNGPTWKTYEPQLRFRK